MMKQLKLYGWRIEQGDPKRGRFVATVEVRDGKVLIHAETPHLERQLHVAIDPAAYRRGFRFASSPHEPGSYETASDPNFLDALVMANGLWIGRSYDGWTIHEVKSKIVEG